VRWQKIALLVFSGWLCVLAKTKCAICAVGFHFVSLSIFSYSVSFFVLATTNTAKNWRAFKPTYVSTGTIVYLL